MRPTRYSIFTIFILSLAGFFIYSNTLSAPFHFDDYFSIVANQKIKDLSNLKIIWDFWPTRFLTYYSLAFNYYFGQLDVTGYHWFNMIVHVVSGILVWWLALITFMTPGLRVYGSNNRVRVWAFFCGLLFIVHPIQTQSVTYVIQRSTSLAALFYLAALAFYAKGRILQYDRGTSIWKIFYCFSLISAAAAMFTKETAITLPFTVILYELCFFGQDKSISRKIMTPFLLALFIIPLTMLLTRSVNFLEMHRAIEPAPGIVPLNYLFTEFRVLNTYLRLLFFPLNQNLDYDYAISRSFTESNVLASFLLLVIILIFAFRMLGNYRLISFSIFWFFLTLLPESSIIPIKDVIFEHRLYLPMFGYCIFVTSPFFYFYGAKNLKVSLIILIVISAIYAGLAYKRNLVWQDGLSLWDDTVSKSPGKARPYNERGFVYLLRGDYGQAIVDFSKTLQMNPKYVSAYNNRGVAYTRKGDYQKAILDFTRATTVEVKYGSAYANRAIVYFYSHEYEKAREDADKARILGAIVDPRFLEDLKKAADSKR